MAGGADTMQGALSFWRAPSDLPGCGGLGVANPQGLLLLPLLFG